MDLTGDGHADVLISEDDVFCWHPSLAEEGFGPRETARQSRDEEQGPKLVFADATQSIYLADLSGDGLTDLVRIRNGEVCYWPNLGYGRFGPKVTMDTAPWFDAPDLFDQKRIRLADIDGSGTTDILYLGAKRIDIYRNLSGNSWSANEPLTAFPHTDNVSSVQAVDLLGNVLRSVAIGYRRRDLPGVDAPEQKQTHLTFTANRFANRPNELDWYRIGLPVETRTYEIAKPPEPTITDTRIDLFRFEAIAALTAGLFPSALLEPGAAKLWPYEKWDWHRNTANAPLDTRLRLIEHVRTLYRKDDLTALLPLGTMEPLALPGESYKLAFTPGLLTGVYGGRVSDAMLETEGRYVHSEGDANWWIPSGRSFFSPGSTDTSAQEFAFARQHFFLPHRSRDPFHTDAVSTESFVTYDAYDLLMVETRDALGNTVHAQSDYRVLAPSVMTDPNGNRSEVAFDTLGMVVATAVKGKLGQNLGDLLEAFDPDPPLAALQGFVADPQGQAASLLGKATTRIVYDLDRYQRSGQPPFAATLARETHFADPGGALTKIQVSFSYSDGFGREIQKKIQAERGDAPQHGPDVTLSGGDVQPGALMRDANGKPVQADTLQRWVGSGRTVFNNKGKPVRQYEPFFSSTHLYEEEREMTDTGVSPILFYDPVERVVATLHPNHTWEKVVFDPWQQTTYDVNDTVLNPDGTTDPKRDSDVQGFFARLPDADYLPTWYEQRSALAATAG